MKTISLRFADNFAPECGTIEAHQELINKNGYVWYGKMGQSLSDKVIETTLSNDNPRILLIKSGKYERYWAYISEISKTTPPLEEIPSYYRDVAETKFKCWFKVYKFEKAPNNIMKYCYVVSSGVPLGVASKSSLNPYSFIEYKEDESTI